MPSAREGPPQPSRPPASGVGGVHSILPRAGRRQPRGGRVAPRAGPSHGLRGQATTEPVVHFCAAAPVHIPAAVDRRNRAAPYLRAIWPNTPDAISESVSESFAEACIAAGDAFPEAMAQVSSWLRPLQYPDRIAHSLNKAQLDARRPESALELMNRIVVDAARGYFPDLTRCLSAVRAAQPDLEHDHRFQRLLEIVRANGGDLN